MVQGQGTGAPPLPAGTGSQDPKRWGGLLAWVGLQHPDTPPVVVEPQRGGSSLSFPKPHCASSPALGMLAHLMSADLCLLLCPLQFRCLSLIPVHVLLFPLTAVTVVQPVV